MQHAGSPLAIKLLTDAGEIEGYGSTFGNVDSYGEMVMPGAFSRSLDQAKRDGRTVKMLWQHNTDQPIGVWDDLREDSTGLFAKGRLLVDTCQQAREAHGLLKARAVDGLSIGYRVVEAKPHPAQRNVLALHHVDLREISVVTFPANEEARTTTVKNIAGAGDIEALFRGAGLSRRRAKYAAYAAWKALTQPNDEEAIDPELFALVEASAARIAKGGR